MNQLATVTVGDKSYRCFVIHAEADWRWHVIEVPNGPPLGNGCAGSVRDAMLQCESLLQSTWNWKGTIPWNG